MQIISAFDDIAFAATGITVTNPAMVARIQIQSAPMTNYEIAAHLANAIANATDAAHARAWEESQFGEARAETLVDHEYFEDLVAAWSMVAIQREIDSLDGLLTEAVSVH